MREVDRIAMEVPGPNLFQMMENAGRNLAAMAIKMPGDGWNKKVVIVFAGSAGNGGGGICAARHMANRGANVKLCLINPQKLTDVAAFQLKIFKAAAGKLIGIEEIENEHPELIIDAIIGYSMQGAPTGNALTAIRWSNLSQVPVLSLDVPSGVDSTTGEAPGDAINNPCTLALALPKTGLLTSHTRELFLADIGIPKEVYRLINLSFNTPFDERFILPLSKK